MSFDLSFRAAFKARRVFLRYSWMGLEIFMFGGKEKKRKNFFLLRNEEENSKFDEFGD